MKALPNPQNIINTFLANPLKSLQMDKYEIKVIIPNFNLEIEKYYPKAALNAKMGKKSIFTHFGLEVSYKSPSEIDLFTDEFVLDDDVKLLVKEFGPILFKNAFVPQKLRSHSQSLEAILNEIFSLTLCFMSIGALTLIINTPYL